ncbi:MAG: DUF1428 domain-containing protein [Phycisphaerae bacterium]|nr:DUF1428 domain-containing protein [Phycisphaerae bacterium]
MAYVDGFVIVVPTRKLPAYWKLARASSKIWLELGASEYRECAGDDLNIPFGVPFPKLAKAKPGETVVFSWIVYKNKATRDRVNARVMKDPRILAMCDPKNMPFDMKRMSMGGFKVVVSALKA